MTVCNRSNDMILGMLGANVVHFSFLQEYLACCIGVQVGVYNQFSNNLHVYTNNFKPDKWVDKDRNMHSPELVEYAKSKEDQTVNGGVLPCSFPLVTHPEVFDRECAEFVERHSKDALAGPYREPFLAYVAQPMMIAFHHYKRKDFGAAMSSIHQVQSEDWKHAGTVWLEKRKRNHERRTRETV